MEKQTGKVCRSENVSVCVWVYVCVWQCTDNLVSSPAPSSGWSERERRRVWEITQGGSVQRAEIPRQVLIWKLASTTRCKTAQEEVLQARLGRHSQVLQRADRCRYRRSSASIRLGELETPAAEGCRRVLAGETCLWRCQRLWKVILFRSSAYSFRPSACRQRAFDYGVCVSTYRPDDGNREAGLAHKCRFIRQITVKAGEWVICVLLHKAVKQFWKHIVDTNGIAL